jgi:lipopolysaccharide biosynthesis regulator YciM
MMGRVWMEKGDYAKAVESLERVIDQDKELVGETLEMLQTCYQQLGKPMNGNFSCAAASRKTPGRPPS